MRNEFTAILERDGDWHVAYCPEVPGANGQGRSKDEARANLAEAIALILQDRREDSLGSRAKANLRDRLKQGAMARADRDLAIADEWFTLDEQACTRGPAAGRAR